MTQSGWQDAIVQTKKSCRVSSSHLQYTKKTLKKAIVTGPKEQVAILILKKADAQIKANTVNKI